MGYVLKERKTRYNYHRKHPMRLTSAVSNSIYRHHIYKITDILTYLSWKGRRCFILGGGPSLSGFDYSRLDGELTIGINRVFNNYSPTMIYCMDTPLYTSIISGKLNEYTGEEIKKKWETYPGIKVFISPMNKFDFEKNDSIYLVKRLQEKKISLNINDGIYPGDNSGFGAIMLAIALGCREIYLLGFDMKLTGNKTHYHNGYPGQKIDKLGAKLEEYRKTFFNFKTKFDILGIDVINTNKDSALSIYKYKDIDEVLI